jgi:hypothetical protein
MSRKPRRATVVPPILAEIENAVADATERGYRVHTVLLPEARRAEFVDALVSLYGDWPELLAVRDPGASGISVGGCLIDFADAPRMRLIAHERIEVGRERPGDRAGVAFQPVDSAVIGSDATAFVAVAGNLVGYYVAPLPEPVLEELRFLSGHGSHIVARMIPVMGALEHEPPWVMDFQSREDLDELRRRMRERVGRDLFAMNDEAH